MNNILQYLSTNGKSDKSQTIRFILNFIRIGGNYFCRNNYAQPNYYSKRNNFSKVVEDTQFDLAEVDENGDQVVMGINLTQYDKPDYSNKHVLSHKTSFEEWLDANYADDKSTSKVLRAADLQNINGILE